MYIMVMDQCLHVKSSFEREDTMSNKSNLVKEDTSKACEEEDAQEACMDGSGLLSDESLASVVGGALVHPISPGWKNPSQTNDPHYNTKQ